MLKISLIIRNKTLWGKQITREFLGLRMQNFQVIVLYERKHIGRFSNPYKGTKVV